MTPGLVPQRSSDPAGATDVVETFLAALLAKDLDAAAELLDEAVAYTNVGLQTIRGRRRVIKVLSLLDRPFASFELYMHAIAATGSTVLTERTDVLQFGPVRLQFWVTGRFDVRNGQITLWRDSFDFLDTTRALVRGLLGAVIPALRPKAPSSPDTAPGRH